MLRIREENSTVNCLDLKIEFGASKQKQRNRGTSASIEEGHRRLEQRSQIKIVGI